MLGITRQVKREKFASPNTKDNNMLVFLALGNAKELSFALVDAKVPSVNDFAFWWNIGLKVYFRAVLSTGPCANSKPCSLRTSQLHVVPF